MYGSSCRSEWVLTVQRTISSGWTNSSEQKYLALVIRPPHRTWTLSQMCDNWTIQESDCWSEFSRELEYFTHRIHTTKDRTVASQSSVDVSSLGSATSVVLTEQPLVCIKHVFYFCKNDLMILLGDIWSLSPQNVLCRESWLTCTWSTSPGTSPMPTWSGPWEPTLRFQFSGWHVCLWQLERHQWSCIQTDIGIQKYWGMQAPGLHEAGKRLWFNLGWRRLPRMCWGILLQRCSKLLKGKTDNNHKVNTAVQDVLIAFYRRSKPEEAFVDLVSAMMKCGMGTEVKMQLHFFCDEQCWRNKMNSKTPSRIKVEQERKERKENTRHALLMDSSRPHPDHHSSLASSFWTCLFFRNLENLLSWRVQETRFSDFCGFTRTNFKVCTTNKIYFLLLVFNVSCKTCCRLATFMLSDAEF